MIRLLYATTLSLSSIAPSVALAASTDEGWITHRVAISPDLRTVVHGTMHAERGTSLLVAGDTEKNAERGRVTYHFGPVRDISFTADGSRFATTTGNGCVRIFDSATLAMLHEHSGHRSWVLAVALSPDGKRFASAGRDRTFRLRDTKSGDEIWRQTMDTWVGELAYLPEGGDVLSADANGAVLRWSPDGKYTPVTSSLPRVVAMAVSHDGTKLATVHRNGELRVFDLKKTKLMWKAVADRERAYALSWSPNDKRIATVGSSGGVRIWGSPGGELIEFIQTDRAMIDVRWGRDRLVAADYYGRAESWRETEDKKAPRFRRLKTDP